MNSSFYNNGNLIGHHTQWTQFYTRSIISIMRDDNCNYIIIWTIGSPWWQN